MKFDNLIHDKVKIFKMLNIFFILLILTINYSMIVNVICIYFILIPISGIIHNKSGKLFSKKTLEKRPDLFNKYKDFNKDGSETIGGMKTNRQNEFDTIDDFELKKLYIEFKNNVSIGKNTIITFFILNICIIMRFYLHFYF